MKKENVLVFAVVLFLKSDVPHVFYLY